MSRPISAAWKREPTAVPTRAIIDMTVEVRDKKQLERVVSAMRRISGVRDIERVNLVTAEPEHIAISKSKGIKIDWKDRHHSEYALGLPSR